MLLLLYCGSVVEASMACSQCRCERNTVIVWQDYDTNLANASRGRRMYLLSTGYA